RAAAEGLPAGFHYHHLVGPSQGSVIRLVSGQAKGPVRLDDATGTGLLFGQVEHDAAERRLSNTPTPQAGISTRAGRRFAAVAICVFSAPGRAPVVYPMAARHRIAQSPLRVPWPRL